MRATIEEALRRAVVGAEAEHDERSRRQAQYLESLGRLADLSLLGSDEMWR